MPLKPRTNLIRFPQAPEYALIRVYRSDPGKPFVLIDEFDPRKFEGLFQDGGLLNGTTYRYRLVGVGKGGEESCPSKIFSGMPREDPFPPLGSIQIDEGRPFTDSAEVELGMIAGDDVTAMLIANRPDFTGLKPIDFTPKLPWKLAPDPKGYAAVYVKFIDKAGNESTTYSDDIQVMKRGALGGIGGRALLAGVKDASGVFVRLLDGPALPATTGPAGAFL